MKKLIILDRDGVINQDSPDYIKSIDEWIPIPESLEAIAALNKAGYQVAVATNQSGIGRGYYTVETLENIHQKMRDHLKLCNGHLDGIFFCPHNPIDHCTCRKPAPDLFHQIFNHFNLRAPFNDIISIGDSLRDLEAAQKAGCTPLLVLTGNGEKTKQKLPSTLLDIPIYANLAAAVSALLARNNHDLS
jgi:D-glycero-D-manno-heptose 1,7-bisphosphate phosphatase